MKAFESYHPIILFFYFFSMIFVTMFTTNPILLVISFVGSILFCWMLIGTNEMLKSLGYSLIMMLIMAITNPLFVHRGETILFFMNGNPITLEAILYGLNISLMIIAVFYWFKCYNLVMTSDKVIYLFGRMIPKLSLLISMVINYVPKFKRRYHEIDDAQKALGFYSQESYIDKIKSKFRILSILVTWSLENSVEMADSMRSRGYGLKGRSSYSIFKWTVRDTLMMCITLLLSIAVFTILGMGYGTFEFYPVVSQFDVSAAALVLYIALFLFAFVAFISEIKENLLWRYLSLKI